MKRIHSRVTIGIWLLLILLAGLSSETYAASGKGQIAIVIPSVVRFQYAPTAQGAQDGLLVGASRNLQLNRAILIERSDTPPSLGEIQDIDNQTDSGKKEYITISIL